VGALGERILIGRDRAADAGLGLVEVVIAMFLFAIIALAAIPVLIQGMRTSADNATMATAAQLASRDIESARSVAASCSALRSYATTAASTTTDERGIRYTMARSVGPCPTTLPLVPAVIDFSATVKVGTATFATVATKVLVIS
jgi:type II secretory pathway pseudopilin PulG